MIDRNPQKAYLQGRQDGEAISHAKDIERGINFAYSHMLISLYNANDRGGEGKRDFLSKPQLAELYKRFVEELQEQICKTLKGERGIDSYDVADLYCAHDKEVRKRLGLPLKSYDGRNEVL